MFQFVIRGLKGFVLGLSMVFPGISGGTMAFVMGIYEKLIREISKFQIQHLKKLVLCFSLNKNQIKSNLSFLKNSWDWSFLIPLMVGVLLALIVFIKWADFLIHKYSLEFYSVIFGLILGTVIFTFQRAQKNKVFFLFFLSSFFLNFILFTVGSEFFSSSKDSSVFIFLPIGFLVSIALIVPGLSGSYLLLILGLYEQTIGILKNLELFVIFIFIVGMALGFVLTAKLIQKMLEKYFNQSLAIILGLMLGSLYSIYPLETNSLSDIFSFNKNQILFLIYMSAGFLCFMAFHTAFFDQKRK